MKIMQWIAFIFIACILIMRGVFPDFFIVDRLSAGLLLLLSMPLLAPYLKKAKWLGAEFEFKDEIKKLNGIVEKTEQEAKKVESKGASSIRILETFSTQNASKLLDSDPNLSLAALRIDLEKVLAKAAYKLIDLSKDKKAGNRFYISKLSEKGVISREQGQALNTIIDMCNKAVHGANISTKEAREIIALTERLNKSFFVGYSINFEKNREFAQQGLFCEWEHCVEYFPLEKDKTVLSCPVFGHDCPGGMDARKECNRTIDEVPKKRFVGRK